MSQHEGNLVFRSQKEYNDAVARGLDMFRAGISAEDRAQTERMHRAQDGEYVEMYVRDAITGNLLQKFSIQMTESYSDMRLQIAQEMERIKKLLPLHGDRMIVCHE